MILLFQRRSYDAKQHASGYHDEGSDHLSLPAVKEHCLLPLGEILFRAIGGIMWGQAVSKFLNSAAVERAGSRKPLTAV
jgi:hypothetical protein